MSKIINENYCFGSFDCVNKADYTLFLDEIKKKDGKLFEDMTAEPDGETVQFPFYKDTDKKIIGIIQLRQKDFKTKGSIGYVIRPSLRNRGYGKMMLSQFLSFAEIISVPFVSARIAKENEASVRTVKSCGFNLISEDETSYLFAKACGEYGYITKINGVNLFIETTPELFSPKGPDRGTLAMLSVADIKKNSKILDLGCGAGIVGIYARKKLSGGCILFQCDISESAVNITKKNCEFEGIDSNIIVSDAFDNIPEDKFDIILSNPPYHTDFSVAKKFIEQSFRHLAAGGKIYMVTKRLDWYKNKLTAVFGGVKIYETDGYFVFESEKRSDKKPEKQKNTNKMSKKLQRKAEKLNFKKNGPRI